MKIITTQKDEFQRFYRKLLQMNYIFYDSAICSMELHVKLSAWKCSRQCSSRRISFWRFRRLSKRSCIFPNLLTDTVVRFSGPHRTSVVEYSFLRDSLYSFFPVYNQELGHIHPCPESVTASAGLPTSYAKCSGSLNRMNASIKFKLMVFHVFVWHSTVSLFWKQNFHYTVDWPISPSWFSIQTSSAVSRRHKKHVNIL